jgi:hypothetical protein
MKSFILLAARVAFCISRAIQSTRCILDIISRSLLVIVIFHGLPLVVLLPAIVAVFEQ